MKGKEVLEWKHIVRPGADECHYRNNLVAGAHLIQFVTDTLACLSCVRENTGGLLANINANFRDEVHAMDELVVTLRLQKEGNTSRTYSFVIEKTIEYANDGSSTATVLDTPKVVVDGTCVLVVKPH